MTETVEQVGSDHTMLVCTVEECKHLKSCLDLPICSSSSFWPTCVGQEKSTWELGVRMHTDVGRLDQQGQQALHLLMQPQLLQIPAHKPASKFRAQSLHLVAAGTETMPAVGL